jgi:hypothetical protein
MTFKLSNDTIQVLKNFSLINSGMLFTPGKVLQTLEPTKSILAYAQIDEEIPSEFAIADLSRFLGVLSMHNEKTLEVTVGPGLQVHLSSDDGSRTTVYRTTEKSNITYPTKRIPVPTPDAELKLTADQIASITSDAASLGLPHIVFKGNEVILTDTKNDAADTHKVILADQKPGNFTAVFKVENFSKLLKNKAYTLELSKLSHFVSDDNKIEYFIALEKWSAE